MDGRFSVNEARPIIRQLVEVRQSMEDLWCRVITPMMSLFSWRLLHNIVPMDKSVKRRGVSLSSKCQCCSQEETMSYVFIDRTNTKEV